MLVSFVQRLGLTSTFTQARQGALESPKRARVNVLVSFVQKLGLTSTFTQARQGALDKQTFLGSVLSPVSLTDGQNITPMNYFRWIFFSISEGENAQKHKEIIELRGARRFAVVQSF